MHEDEPCCGSPMIMPDSRGITQAMQRKIMSLQASGIRKIIGLVPDDLGLEERLSEVRGGVTGGRHVLKLLQSD